MYRCAIVAGTIAQALDVGLVVVAQRLCGSLAFTEVDEAVEVTENEFHVTPCEP